MNSQCINLCPNFFLFLYYIYLEGTEYIKILLSLVAVKRTMTSLSWRPASHIGRLWKNDRMWMCFTISMFRSSVLKVKKLNFYYWVRGSERTISTSSRNASWWNQDYYLHVKWKFQGIWWIQFIKFEESNSSTFLGHYLSLKTFLIPTAEDYSWHLVRWDQEWS